MRRVKCWARSPAANAGRRYRLQFDNSAMEHFGKLAFEPCWFCGYQPLPPTPVRHLDALQRQPF